MTHYSYFSLLLLLKVILLKVRGSASCLSPRQNPPNFLRASALSEHISPVVVIPAESSSPESEHVVETEDLVDTEVPSQPVSLTASHCYDSASQGLKGP
jgi:hypothetical protein